MIDFTCDTNYLAPARFKVLIDRTNYPSLQFYAQQVQHPSIDLNAVEVPYRRVGSVAVPGDAISYNLLSFDVIVDEKMQVYEELYDWMKRLVETRHELSSIEKPTYSDISISVLSSHNNVLRNITYVNALLTGIGDISFTSLSEEQFITFPVTFRFDYFDMI